jgi:hypothetical protein
LFARFGGNDINGLRGELFFPGKIPAQYRAEAHHEFSIIERWWTALD